MRKSNKLMELGKLVRAEAIKQGVNPTFALAVFVNAYKEYKQDQRNLEQRSDYIKMVEQGAYDRMYQKAMDYIRRNSGWTCEWG